MHRAVHPLFLPVVALFPDFLALVDIDAACRRLGREAATAEVVPRIILCGAVGGYRADARRLVTHDAAHLAPPPFLVKTTERRSLLLNDIS